jgi:glyoxylase-like metal-dependent hydrolase (beta-lactamase superfamily II)/rhodanese-related sulfurtransferase
VVASPFVLFRQFVDEDLGCASYLVGDEEAGEAVVVDPAYAVEPYLEEAERRDVRIVRVLETHTHADHVSGHGRLALEHDIPASVHPAAATAYPHDALADGDEIAVGDVVIRVVHTPGHRPEHCAFAVVDRTRGDEPWLVLTGDSLFVGDTARPDLAVEADEGARDLFTSLRRLVELGDGVEVYPGHVAGSLCGRAMSSKASTTIGFERRFNHRLVLADEEAFVADALGDTAVARPPNMERIVELNRGPFVGASAPLERATGAGGAVVVDVRAFDEFARGHLAGAINVPVSGTSFATKAAFVLTPEDLVVLYARDREEAERAARGLRAVGFLELGGFLEGGDASERLDTVTLDDLDRLLADGGVQLLDVREKYERDGGYIAGSQHVPYRLLRALTPPLEEGKPVVTICGSGARAAIAASVLAAAGVDARPVIDGGVEDWEARGGKTVEFRRCGS